MDCRAVGRAIDGADARFHKPSAVPAGSFPADNIIRMGVGKFDGSEVLAFKCSAPLHERKYLPLPPSR